MVADLVAERVEKSHARISAKRLLPIARAARYEGSAHNFRRLVAEAKALWRSQNHSGRRPAVWSPGQYLVIDWAQATPGLFLFCAVLAFSRWRFVRIATDQKASTTLALIAEALAAIGGVPARVLADRMACLKGGVVANVVVPTPEYVRLAGHYGFSPDFCHANDPQSKGVVENLCGYAQRDLAVPLLTQAAVDGVTVDIGRPTPLLWRGAPRSTPWFTPRSRPFPTNAWPPNANSCNHSHRYGCRSGHSRCSQGRPAVLCAVWVGPLLATHATHRHHRGRRCGSRRGVPGRTVDGGDRGRTRTRRPR